MEYIPTTFVDRSVEFPNRRKLTAVSGLSDTFDVARAEGTVFAEGTKPDAANLNAEFGKIKTETDAINTNLNAEIASSVKYDFFTRTVITTETVGKYYYDLDVSTYVTNSTNQVLNVHADLLGIQSESFRMQGITTVRIFFSAAVNNKVVNFSIMYKN